MIFSSPKGFPPVVVVSRPHDPAQPVLVVVSPELADDQVRHLARFLLNPAERRRLARFLARR